MYLAAELSDAEAAAAVGIFGLGVMTLVIMAVIWYVLVIIGDWKLFEKAGKPGWHSIIPFLNMYDEYDLCWNGAMGICYMVMLSVASGFSSGDAETTGIKAIIAGLAGLLALILRIVQSNKLAKAFGKGIGFTIFLIIFERIGRVILGLGSSEYQGKQ